MKRTIIMVGIISSIFYASCSNSVSSSDIAGALEDRLSDALQFQGGTVVEDEKPEENSGDSAYPQISDVTFPSVLGLNEDFTVEITTSNASASDVKGAVVFVAGASKYIEVKGQLKSSSSSTQTRVGNKIIIKAAQTSGQIMELLGTLLGDTSLMGNSFNVDFALLNGNGDIGNYIRRGLYIGNYSGGNGAGTQNEPETERYDYENTYSQPDQNQQSGYDYTNEGEGEGEGEEGRENGWGEGEGESGCVSDSDCADDETCVNYLCVARESGNLAKQLGESCINDSDCEGWLVCAPSGVCCLSRFEDLCDGLDNDCNGVIDEMWPELGYSCSVGYGVCMSDGVFGCRGDGLGVECQGDIVNRAQPERCDGFDNDCDGEVDEDFLPDPYNLGQNCPISEPREGAYYLCDWTGTDTFCADAIDAIVYGLIKDCNLQQVSVKVTALDTDGHPITEHIGSNFYFYVEQSIDGGRFDSLTPEVDEPVSGQEVSIAAALTLDYSGSMPLESIDKMEKAVQHFFSLYRKDDQGAIVKFSTSSTVFQPLTDDKQLLQDKAVEPYPDAGGSTALFDSIWDAVMQVRDQKNSPFVIAFTDGGENSSIHNRVEDVIMFAKSFNIPVFTIGFSSGQDKETLQKIAHETNAVYFDAEDPNYDLQDLYDYLHRIAQKAYTVRWPLPCCTTQALPGTPLYYQIWLNYYDGLTSFTKILYSQTQQCDPCGSGPVVTHNIELGAGY